MTGGGRPLFPVRLTVQPGHLYFFDPATEVAIVARLRAAFPGLGLLFVE